MGNIVTNEILDNTTIPNNQLNTSSTDTPNTNSKTILGDYILLWAKNHYSISSTSPNTNVNIIYYKNQLKKRACCTNYSMVPIGLPGLTSN